MVNLNTPLRTLQAITAIVTLSVNGYGVHRPQLFLRAVRFANHGYNSVALVLRAHAAFRLPQCTALSACNRIRDPPGSSLPVLQPSPLNHPLEPHLESKILQQMGCPLSRQYHLHIMVLWVP